MTGDMPVVGIDWHDAIRYCEWRTEHDPRFRYRLPSVNEWLLAAHTTDGRIFPWGDVFSFGFCKSAFARAEAVRTRKLGFPEPVLRFLADESPQRRARPRGQRGGVDRGPEPAERCGDHGRLLDGREPQGVPTHVGVPLEQSATAWKLGIRLCAEEKPRSEVR